MNDSVNRIMTPIPFFVGPMATIEEVREMMIERDVRHIPVVNDGELIGIISDRDLGRILLSRTEEFDNDELEARLEQPVSRFMSGDVLSVDTESDIAEVIELLLESKVGALPVLDAENGKLKGMVSYIDVLKAAQPLFGA